MKTTLVNRKTYYCQVNDGIEWVTYFTETTHDAAKKRLAWMKGVYCFPLRIVEFAKTYSVID